MDPSEYEKMKEDLEALNLEKEQRLVKDAQIEEAMQKLRDEIDEQILKNEGTNLTSFQPLTSYSRVENKVQINKGGSS